MKQRKRIALGILCGVFCGCGAVGMASCDLQAILDGLYGNSAWDTNGFYIESHIQDGQLLATIEGVRELEGTDVVIPQTVDIDPERLGVPVVGINNTAFRGLGITSVTIPATITQIDMDAFADCTSLKKVYYQGTATQWANIGFFNAEANPLAYATEFYIDGKLVSDVTIEEGIDMVKPYAFYSVESLKTVTIPASVKVVGTFAFAFCENLYKVDLAEGITVLDDAAFLAADLNEVVIPNSVTYVGMSTFQDCDLTKLTIGARVKEVGNSAFAGNLTLSELQYNATECGDFEYANYIFNVTIDDVTQEHGLKVTVGANVQRLPNNLFSSCVFTKEILFEQDSVCTYIGENALGFNDLMTKVEIPDSVEYMGEQSFKHSPNLQYNEYENGYYLGNETNPCVVLVDVKDETVTSFTIHKGTKVIQEYALSECNNLRMVVIPGVVRYIGRNVFGGRPSLEAVYYEGTQQQWEKINIDESIGSAINGNMEWLRKARYYYSEMLPTDNNGYYWHYDGNGEIVVW